MVVLEENNFILNWRTLFQKELKLDINGISELYDISDIFDEIEFKQFSRFPKIDLEGIKSNYVEMFYQKVLDKSISKSNYEIEEKRIHDTVSMFWVYDDLYYCRCLSKKDVKKTNGYKTKKALFHNTVNNISCSSTYIDALYPVNFGEELSSLLYIATRGVPDVWFLGRKSKTLLVISDCILLAFNPDNDYQFLTEIALSNGLLELK